MTAQTLFGATPAPRSAERRLAGFGTLVRKDLTEWMRGRRAWVVLAATTAFMALTAANGRIVEMVAATAPDGAVIQQFSLVPMDNLLAAVAAQVFVLATILATGSLLVAERQSGTLAWVASKPVSRASIWLAKWASASAMLALSAVIVPTIATVALVVVLYGVPPLGAVLGLLLGMVALATFFAAFGVAAGTVLPGQPAVIAVGFGLFAILPIIGGLAPIDIAPVLPTSILPWFASAFAGSPVSWVTPIAFALATGAVAAFGIWRMARLEL